MVVGGRGGGREKVVWREMALFVGAELFFFFSSTSLLFHSEVGRCVERQAKTFWVLGYELPQTTSMDTFNQKNAIVRGTSHYGTLCCRWVRLYLKLGMVFTLWQGRLCQLDF